MTIELATSKIQKLAEVHSGKLRSKVKFVFDEGVIFLDDSQSPTIVNNENNAADCTMVLSLSTLERLMEGDLNPMMAFMTGKLKIEGDKGIAMKLSSLF